MDLKKQIKAELQKQKEEKLKVEKDINSKLVEINLYSLPDHPSSKMFKTYYDDNAISYKNYDLRDHKTINSIVQFNTPLIIEVNKEYVALNRDFHNPIQSIGILRHIAHPDFVSPPVEERLLQAIKNLNINIGKQLGNFHNSLRPIVSVMNDLTKEIKEEELAKNKKSKKKVKKGA